MPTIEVTGMGCDGCEDIVENAVGEVYGVDEVEADYETGVVEYEGDVDRDDITEAIEFADYAVAGEPAAEETES